MAKSVASNYIKWGDVKVSNQKPLYDYAANQIGYSVDITNKKTNEKGFILLSSILDDEPVIEFATGSYSIYDKVSNQNDKCILENVGGYHALSSFSNKYYEIYSQKTIPVEAVTEFKNDANKHVYNSRNIANAKSIRLQLLTNEKKLTPFDASSSKQVELPHCPDYMWRDGCSPTSAAMVIDTLYDSYTPYCSTLIDKLANYMGTDSSGSTYIYMIQRGINGACRDYGIKATSEYVWSLPTFTEYSNAIDAHCPAVISLCGSKATAPSYKNGFGDHSLCGYGYYYSPGADYLIVHDTECDGKVWVNYYSSSLGLDSFNILRPYQ